MEKESNSTSQHTDPITRVDAMDGGEQEEEEEEEAELDTAWDDWQSEGKEEPQPDLLCLFCDSKFTSNETLFQHCCVDHGFDFPSVRKELGLDFYGCVKLINFIRAKVAEDKCWRFGCADGFAWEDDRWLRPVLEYDALLHRFDEDEECDFEDNGCVMAADGEELMREFGRGVDLSGLVESRDSVDEIELGSLNESGAHRVSGSCEEREIDAGIEKVGRAANRGGSEEDKRLRVSFANVAAKELKKADDSYFCSYGSFVIHREMLGDKVRMDAYGNSLLKNPSLMKGAAVMDVGCGTGILSLFAAKAGASSVVAVEASEKMASVAKQIVKENGLSSEDDQNKDCTQHGVIKVVHGMVEELDKLIEMPRHSIDVLVSEWMGYCLLFETMLDSVLYARDHWLKPGGAILPDTATVFAAGFGRGGTGLPFWENVYGFDMSSIGKEVLEAAAQSPIIDVVDAKDIITETAILQKFDLATMKLDEVDFTSSVELELKSALSVDNVSEKKSVTWCYGIVLWFETGFTSRFCRETPTILSTSPYSRKTHWSQAVFTFNDPIAMSQLPLSHSTGTSKGSIIIGSEGCPATKISARISIARASIHRSIDISLEVTVIGGDGRKHSFPVQIFDL